MDAQGDGAGDWVSPGVAASVGVSVGVVPEEGHVPSCSSTDVTHGDGVTPPAAGDVDAHITHGDGVTPPAAGDVDAHVTHGDGVTPPAAGDVDALDDAHACPGGDELDVVGVGEGSDVDVVGVGEGSDVDDVGDGEGSDVDDVGDGEGSDVDDGDDGEGSDVDDGDGVGDVDSGPTGDPPHAATPSWSRRTKPMQAVPRRVTILRPAPLVHGFVRCASSAKGS